jgi:hypothetical protein
MSKILAKTNKFDLWAFLPCSVSELKETSSLGLDRGPFSEAVVVVSVIAFSKQTFSVVAARCRA